MARFVGNWAPESEAEEAFILEINEVAREAYEAGVDPADIVAAFAFLQGAYLESDAVAPTESAAPESETADLSAAPHCPACEGEVADVHMGLGGMCEVSPCGCRVEIDALEEAGWSADG